MDGIHDLGGKQGFGPVTREVAEAVFHERWEAAVFTMVRAARVAGTIRNTDQFRHAVERIEPVAYLTHGYYGRWLGGVENLLVEADVISTIELTQRAQTLGGTASAKIAAQPDTAFGPIAPEVAQGAKREISELALFSIGQKVKTTSATSKGHTRLPAYARGRTGRIVALHGGWVLPDTNAHGLGEAPQHLYTVEFAGEQLWGNETEPGLRVCLDLFESYLEKTGE